MRLAHELETILQSQSHAGLNLAQFQADFLLRMNSSSAVLNYLELFESILGIATTWTNEKYWYFTLRPHKLVCHESLFFINYECITWQFKNLFH